MLPVSDGIERVTERPWFSMRNGTIVLTYDGKQRQVLTFAALLRCHTWVWGNDFEMRRRGPVNKTAPAPLNLIDKLWDAQTGEWEIQFIFGGDPSELYKRMKLYQHGELYAENKEFRNYHQEFLNIESEMRTEVAKRMAATKGGTHVTSS